MKKLIVEFIGTFFLLFIIGCTLTSGSVIPGLAIGSILMVMVYAGGHISGAHYNPAVSLAVMLRGRISGGEMIQYWIVQLIGGVAGAWCSYYISGSNPVSVSHHPGEGVSHITALVAELLGTFALAYVVLNVATAKSTQGNSFYGLAIGFTLFVIAAGMGSVSGGAFNPAVGLGRNISDFLMTGGSLQHSWIYLVGPLAGGTLAGLVFNYLNPDDK